MKEINREHFEAWLFNQPKDKVIEAGFGDRCVFCSFIKETTSNSRAFFSGWDKWTTARHTEPYTELPAWSQQLVNKKWLTSQCNNTFSYAVTVEKIQQRYLELFPDTEREQFVPVVEEQKEKTLL